LLKAVTGTSFFIIRETLDQKKRAVRRRFSARKGGALLWKGIEPLSVNYVCEKSPDSLGVW